MTELSKEQRRLSQTVEIYEKYKGILSDIETAKEMLNDKDMQEFAKEEISNLTTEKETIEKVNKLKPELKLIERYNQWSGDFFNIIIFQMNSIANTKEYAIYVTTKKPNVAVQKIAHELLEKHKSQLVSNGFSVESYYFYMRGHYCKSFDFLDAYYSHKNVRNKKFKCIFIRIKTQIIT